MHEAELTPDSPASQQQKLVLPPLAPRKSKGESKLEHTAQSTSGRPPRLTHRSRAGCWTCRGRKVGNIKQARGFLSSSESMLISSTGKPCARLNRECDWNHRWNFNDATGVTQGKHANVTTAGSAVWDPSVRTSVNSRSQSPEYDDLPAFDVLATDEERERKAEIHSPGKFNVVVTPESFSDLPEYASAVSPASSRQNSFDRHFGPSGISHAFTARSSISEGSTTVVLRHFEDVSPAVLSSHSSPATPRRSSFPEYLQTLSISAPLPPKQTVETMLSMPKVPTGKDRTLKHFNRFIVPKLVQPALWGDDRGFKASTCPTQCVFENEAARFKPLHHAIRAVSALNLANIGMASLEEAMQHYQDALASWVDPTKADDLLSNGVFLRHFLLFIYDICVPMSPENGGAGMWAEHLRHLMQLAVKRHHRAGHEPLGYIVWTICELDMYAGIRGNGTCGFIRAMIDEGMLPELHQQIPNPGLEAGTLYLADEARIFPAILALNQQIVVKTAELAELRNSFHSTHPAADLMPTSPYHYAKWQASVSRAQTDLLSTWSMFYPRILGPESVESGSSLPPRVRFVFEHAFALFYAAVLYSRTSMFPKQRLLPIADERSIIADTERRCAGILTLAAANMLSDQERPDYYSRRRIVFPIFMAGIATSSPTTKRQALDLLKRLERHGAIGQNTCYTRQLLVAVAEAQERAQQQGMAVESVEWLNVAQEKGLNVVNCGL
nr:hypothetical protein CFP56_71039 [Quercus suber]